MVVSLLLLVFVVQNIPNCYSENYDFEGLIFSQHWPKTVCSQWEESNPSNTCIIPQHNSWTAHGIWPTKIGTQGPQNCNKTWHFNTDQLSPIMSDLDQLWTNIEKNTAHSSFWKHEWDKHGTCAAQIDRLDSELKYFSQGLDWVRQYNLRDILLRSGITPSGETYEVETIYHAIKLVTNRNPIIQCVIDRRNKLSLLSEIRICFDKDLEIIDCDLFKSNYGNSLHLSNGNNDGDDDILTNCDRNKEVVYLDEVSDVDGYYNYERYLENRQFMDNMLITHKLLQFMIWLTI